MAQVKMQTARTTLTEPAAAAEDLLSQLGNVKPVLVTMFASRNRDQHALNRAVRERLPPGTRLIGATTAGELDNTGIHEGSVVLSALSGDVEVGLGLGTQLSVDAITAGQNAIKRACEDLGVRQQDLDPRRYVGLVIDDGFRYKKEELLLGILERSQTLVLVGGGASDDNRDPAKQSALVHVDGEVATDAVLVALFRTSAPWAALRSHWYVPTGEKLTITKVDESHTRALEIDGHPAARRYAEILGVKDVKDLEFGTPEGFAVRPTALRVGREYFIRAAWRPQEDGSILFANLLEEGTELELMKLGDMAGMTRGFFTDEMPRRVQNPQAALLFHCGGRMWYAHATNSVAQLAETLKAAPTAAGMNVHFEIYSGFHINTTLTALVFGAN
ncbi:FIST C-terminal domain-containing protein [Myxococcus sp. MISCRS1]|uniref:FIST signal transduction protein n=1 Tax=Myxococcus TaxID=32 RepID=UPI001CBEAABD|nr:MULTISPECIES: FIST N-terminal domain-containing protein [unclassified Myxococcus]MBZ4395760.1 FIST C-terminal domain-containing protein [Myxococcus sp. AS-1-15]MBZ4411376.1 FIST C-terminal domain-containing protein [Myxococcus sp. XM-1-1-1]MCY0998877.1 FIST C-terminal domain-containing protein [Myxococcus sp. MISCRS1]BDT31120.1 FIST C-terminal domain-containing protein [Myxococcus sp. MH1]